MRTTLHVMHMSCSDPSPVALPTAMSEPPATTLRSKQWSCSDLSRGAKQVMGAKKEVTSDEDDMAAKIQATVAELLLSPEVG